jgi:hypothetical protein
VSPERDEPTEDQEQELYEDVPPRSIFAATWFRVVLVVIVLGVIGAVAVPYALDWMNPPPPPRSAATRVPGTSPLPPAVFDTPAADKPLADRPAADKPDSTMIPAPAAPTPPPAPTPPARTDLKNETKPGATTAPNPPAPPKTTAKAAAPPAKPAPPEKPAPSETKGKSAAADSPAKPSVPAKSEPAAKSEPKADTPGKPSPRRTAAAKATPATPAASGPFWVQVGAFKDPEAAKRLAAKLRGENFQVEESVRSATTPAPKAPAAAPSRSDHYNVFVTGMSVDDLNKRLSGKGLSAETSGNGVVVKPSLPLRDAVALSKDLAVEGLKVQVRRAGGGATATTTPPAASAVPDGGTPLHRVRVGAFSDRTAAQAAARDLAAKGYKPFIARGDQ